MSQCTTDLRIHFPTYAIRLTKYHWVKLLLLLLYQQVYSPLQLSVDVSLTWCSAGCFCVSAGCEYYVNAHRHCSFLCTWRKKPWALGWSRWCTHSAFESYESQNALKVTEIHLTLSFWEQRREKHSLPHSISLTLSLPLSSLYFLLLLFLSEILVFPLPHVFSFVTPKKKSKPSTVGKDNLSK